MDKLQQQLEELIGKAIKVDEPLAPYSTFKIGGPAKYFFIAQDNENLVRAVTFAKKLKIPIYIFGNGSKLLISDQGLNGLVIVNQSKDIVFKLNNKVVADAGVDLMKLINKTVDEGLTGLENLAGIPASVGGAVCNNAGAYGSQIADNLIGVEVMRGSKQFILDNKICNFGYRDSIFKNNNDLIISAEFQLQKGNKQESLKKIKEILESRKIKQPLDYPSVGSIFKNVIINSETEDQVKKIVNLPKEYLESKKIPAAWLIEQLDLKGKTIGQAQISNKHANFIINLGQATADEVIQLISYIKMKVRDSYGLQLHEEIEYIGF